MLRWSVFAAFYLLVAADGFTTTKKNVSPEKNRRTPFLSSPLSNKHHLHQQQGFELKAVVDPDSLLHASNWLADATAVATESASKDLGWWGAYVDLFKNTLSFVHDVIDEPLRSIGVEQTWGISIAVFTASIRSLLLPLSIQQSKSSEYMKALKPYVTEIKAKYKGNDNAANQAVGRLYQDANQNPLAGCAVSLAQLPIFLGLYRGVRYLAIEDKLNEPFLWIPSLEGPVRPPDYRGLDWLTDGWSSNPAGGLPIPQLGWETTLAFLIMPVVLVLLQSFTMQTLQPPVDENASEEEKQQLETSQTVLKFLPLLIGFFSLQVPAGLTIYWFTSNLYTLSQSLAVKAYFSANPPKIELPDYWESALSGDSESMSPEDRRKASEAGIRVGPTFEDMITEAKFHKLIVRKPLRSSGDTSSGDIPDELAEWVKNGPKLEVIETARV